VKVEKLIQSKNVPGRWYAELENGESVRVGTAQVADFSLYAGRELSDDELASLRASASETNAKARALRILGSRMMSRREIADRLREKGETEEDTENAVEFLGRIGALDDAEYAAAIVRQYSSRGYGPGRIRGELSRRGVPRELWDGALAQMPESGETLDGLVRARLRPGADKKEVKKLTDMLLRRGYGWEEIKEALERNRAAEGGD